MIWEIPITWGKLSFTLRAPSPAKEIFISNTLSQMCFWWSGSLVCPSDGGSWGNMRLVLDEKERFCLIFVAFLVPPAMASAWGHRRSLGLP